VKDLAAGTAQDQKFPKFFARSPAASRGEKKEKKN
jgi:hypothetical protein